MSISEAHCPVHCQRLPWDSEFFGVQIARVAGNRLEEELWPQIEAWCAMRKIQCLYFLADGAHAGTLTAAANCGFKYVDLRIDLEMRIRDFVGEEVGSPEVRFATEADRAALSVLARQYQRDTRFFLDSKFCPERAAEMYVEWINKDLTLNKVLVFPISKDSAQPAAYISYQIDKSGSNGRIGLLAVASEARGNGLARRLLIAALADIGEKGCKAAVVATQGVNTAAQRLYQTAGFRTSATGVWFHRWFPSW